MNQFIEVEDEHFKKMLVNVNAIAMVFDKEIIKSEIYLVGNSKPFLCRKNYREVKELIAKVGV